MTLTEDLLYVSQGFGKWRAQTLLVKPTSYSLCKVWSIGIKIKTNHIHLFLNMIDYKVKVEFS